ncbi:MAG: BamA/TamA family outer membrane protein [Acidobacteria bacterium]|nr:BamA/TamA family outer membrane protein [Acidobacteriota bacterium]
MKRVPQPRLPARTRRHAGMDLVWTVLLLAGLAVPAAAQAPEFNVNSRYTVESVEISPERSEGLSRKLREEMQGHVGEKFDQTIFEQLRDRLRREVKAPNVSLKLLRGSRPDCVKVIFEVADHRARVDVTVPRFLYNSRQGWSGEVDAIIISGRNRFTLGVLSDGDSLLERFAGVRACYVRFTFEFGSFHQQWNRATLIADGEGSDPGVYRERQMFEPRLTFSLSRPLTLTTGVSFARLEKQFPAARLESASAVTNTLRYRRYWEGSESNGQELDAGYNLRAATSVLASDFLYTRHAWDVLWSLRHDRHRFTVRFGGGVLTGNAPLFERFTAGNSSTLRGWNKYQIAPLGGNRMAQGSVEYRYRIVEVFCDSGAVWDRGSAPVARNSAGIGIRRDHFLIAVAFPFRGGRTDPVFLAGMNF